MRRGAFFLELQRYCASQVVFWLTDNSGLRFLENARGLRAVEKYSPPRKDRRRTAAPRFKWVDGLRDVDLRGCPIGLWLAHIVWILIGFPVSMRSPFLRSAHSTGLLSWWRSVDDVSARVLSMTDLEDTARYIVEQSAGGARPTASESQLSAGTGFVGPMIRLM